MSQGKLGVIFILRKSNGIFLVERFIQKLRWTVGSFFPFHLSSFPDNFIGPYPSLWRIRNALPATSGAFFLPLEVYSLLALIAQSRQEASCLPSLCTRAFMTSIGRGHQMCLIWQMKCVSSTQSLEGHFSSQVYEISVLWGKQLDPKKCLVTRHMKCVFFALLMWRL